MTDKKTEYNTILIHYGEIGLKGKNRNFFINALKNNIYFKLNKYLEHIKIHYIYGYFYIKNISLSQEDFNSVYNQTKEIFGIANISKGFLIERQDQDLKNLVQEIKEKINKIINYIKDQDTIPQSFAISAKRTDKSFGMRSKEIEIAMGDYVYENSPIKKINLSNPDITFYIDIYHDNVFIYADKSKGMGGLPVGVSGNALSLLSGGIDSPVASYLGAKRGLKTDYIHFTVSLPKKMQEDKIYKIYKELTKYSLKSKLFIVPYIHFNMEIIDKNTKYELILFRRFMLRVAEKLALQSNSQALITGDNLAQVASQTLSNIHTADSATNIPILRPLLTYDKNEIIETAKKIGTYELSIMPYKDCCSIVSKHPYTKSDPKIIEKIEKELFSDYEGMIEKTIKDMIVVE